MSIPYATTCAMTYLCHYLTATWPPLLIPRVLWCPVLQCEHQQGTMLTSLYQRLTTRYQSGHTLTLHHHPQKGSLSRPPCKGTLQGGAGPLTPRTCWHHSVLPQGCWPSRNHGLTWKRDHDLLCHFPDHLSGFISGYGGPSVLSSAVHFPYPPLGLSAVPLTPLRQVVTPTYRPLETLHPLGFLRLSAIPESSLPHCSCGSAL